MADFEKADREPSSDSLERLVSLSDARAACLRYVERHKYMPDNIKPMAKQIVSNHFQSLGVALGSLELTVYRTERRQANATEISHR